MFAEGSNCWRICDATRFGWCIDGEAYYSALHEVLGRAQREILIVGWDIDSRVELIRDPDHPDHPGALCPMLQQLVEDNEALCVRVLAWDFAVVYALERELMPSRAFGWVDSERLHFKLDSQHAAGASHHQKIVVLDGALAFVGGLDLTKARWDTRRHAAKDPRRRDPNGEAYGPFHDVQAVVTGEAAQALRDVVSERWENACGEALPDPGEPEPGDHLWPESVEPKAKNARVAISRTWCRPEGTPDLEEVKQLYLDMISSARQSIYLENQYFTSTSISQAIAARLEEENGPEVVIVLPAETSGWLEQATMDVLRNEAVARMQQADRYDRLRVVSPVSEELGDTSIILHAKVMVADLELARIGSANISGRSMNLDTECDIVVDDPPAAALLCADLLSEHLGADLDAVARSLSDDGLIATLDRFADNERQLVPLEIKPDALEKAVLEPVAKIADLEKPIMRHESVAGSDDSAPSRAGWLMLGAIALVLAFWAYLVSRGSGEDFSLRSMLNALRGIADHPLAPLAVLPAFVAASLVVAPVTGMIALCALLFDPWTAAAAALAGTLAATVVNHWLGSHFNATLMQRVPDAITDRISRIASSSDVWTLAGLRLIPIAPFTFVNLVVGALGIGLRPFLVATVAAMLPGILLICLSVDRARAVLAGEPLFDPWILVGIAGAGLAVIAMRFWRSNRRSDQDASETTAEDESRPQS